MIKRIQWLSSASAAWALALAAVSAQAGTGCLDTVFVDDFEAPSANRYQVGLVVSELGARTASFQLNDGEIVTFSSDGGFCFSGTLEGGQPYLISVIEQPDTGLACASDAPIGIADKPVRVEVVCDLTRTDWNDFSWDQTHWN